MPDQFFPYKMFELHRKLMELTYLLRYEVIVSPQLNFGN